jgi:hypothetical protein
VDEDRRRLERATFAGSDPESLVRHAVELRRSGDLEGARSVLVRAIELAPDHVMARVLLVLVDVALGKSTRGAWHEFRLATNLPGIELVRRIDPAFLDDVARAVIDPAHGPPDFEAVGALANGGRFGVRALLRALADADDRHVWCLLGHARVIAKTPLERGDVPGAFLRRALVALEPGSQHAPFWATLAGALHLTDAREAIERCLDVSEPSEPAPFIIGLEFLNDPASRPALERILPRIRGIAERQLIKRILAALPR